MRLTRNSLNHHNRHRRHLLTPKKCFHGFAESELYAHPTVGPRHIVLPNPTSFNETLSRGPSDRMDIDSPVQTVMHTGRVSRPPGE
jgi:hypothetical protein